MRNNHSNRKKTAIALSIIILMLLIIAVGLLLDNDENKNKNKNTQTEPTTSINYEEYNLNDNEKATYDVLASIYTTLKQPSDFKLIGSAIIKTESGEPLGYIKVSAYSKIRYYTVSDKEGISLQRNIAESSEVEKKSVDLFCKNSGLDIEKIQNYFNMHKPS